MTEVVLDSLAYDSVYRKTGAARLFPQLFEQFLGQADGECVTHMTGL
ncbi:MAG: hypothetical protein WA609_18175 [Terriglobales bacterium]